MPGQFGDISQQITAIRELFVNEAFDAAQQVQGRAEEIQAQSQSVPPRSPVEGGAPIPASGTADKLFWIGFGAVGALGLAYFLMKRGER